MKVLVVGGGGREHALAWKVAQSPRVTKLYCAPGNPGIARIAECVPLAADDLAGLRDFARSQRIDLTVIGPEAPLAARSEEHTSELQSRQYLVCRLLLEKKKKHKPS